MSETNAAALSAQQKTPVKVCQFFSFKTSSVDEPVLQEGKPIYKRGVKVCIKKKKFFVLLVHKNNKLSLPGLKNEEDLDPRILLKNSFTQKLGITIDGKLGNYNDENYESSIYFLKGQVDATLLNSVKKINSVYVDLDKIDMEQLQPISRYAITTFLNKNKN